MNEHITCDTVQYTSAREVFSYNWREGHHNILLVELRSPGTMSPGHVHLEPGQHMPLPCCRTCVIIGCVPAKCDVCSAFENFYCLFLGDLRWVARLGLTRQIGASQILAPIGSVFLKYVYSTFMVKMRTDLGSLGLFWFILGWG